MAMDIDVVGYVPQEMDTSDIDGYQAPAPRPKLNIPLRLLQGEAFYTAATMAPGDLEAMYQEIYDGLTRTEGHPLYQETIKKGAAKRQTDIVKDLSNLATNQEVPFEQKAPIAKALIEDAQTPVTAKEVYLNQVAEEKGKPPMEMEVIGGVDAEVYDKLDKVIAISKDFTDYAKAVGAIGAGLVMSIPAGYFGIYEAIKTKDPAKASEVVQTIQSAMYMPDDEGAQEVMKKIIEVAELLEIPARWVGDTVLDATGSPAAATGAYIALDPLNYIPLGVAFAGRKAVNAYIKQKFPHSKMAREEPTFTDDVVKQGETIFFDKDSPIGEIARIDREKAADIATSIAHSKPLQEGTGVTAREVANTYLLPKLDPELKDIYPDIYYNLEKTDYQFVQQFDANQVSPFLFDVAAIKKDVDWHFEVMDAMNNVYPMMSSSYVEPVGRSLRGRIMYGKRPNKGFDSPEEAIDSMEYMQKAIKDKYGYLRKGELGVKQVEDALGNKEYFITWNYDRRYNPVIDTSLGLDAKFGPFDVSNFANTKFGQWIFSPATRLPTWTTAGPARATINATKLEKIWNDTLRNEVLSTKPRQELAQAIYETEARGQDLSVKDLQEMFPTMAGDNFKSLVNGYTHYRRLVDHMYATMNDIYRTQKVSGGFYGLYDADGKYLDNLGKPVKFEEARLNPDNLEEMLPARREDLIGSDGQLSDSVYDFTRIVQEDPNTPGKLAPVERGEVPVRGLSPDQVVYKLDKPYTKDGKVYEYAIGITEGPVPKALLPKIPGYYPHINMEHYFIKAVPKKLTLNGRVIPNTPENAHIYNAQATTVNVARTEKEARRYADELSKDNKEFTFVPSIERLEVDDTLRTTMDMVKYAQDVSKSRKKDRLTFPDGTLGRLEDPAIALEKRLNQAARLIAWKDQDFYFRQRFTEKYSRLFKDGKFPETIQDLRIPGGGKVNDPMDEKLLKEAVVTFEQYSRQQTRKVSFLGDMWRAGALKIGRVIEDVSPNAGGVVKDLANADPINLPVKLSTFKYIHLNPIRQLFIQPAQLYELHGVALMGGNTKFTADMVNLAPKLWAATFFENASVVPDSVRAYARKHGHVNTPYSEKEFGEILDAFRQSGIPYAVDMNAILDGVFKSASDKLDVGSAQQMFDKMTALTKGTIHLPKQYGFNAAELMNNVGLWLYARSEFIKNNPTKKWNDPHNLEMIAAKAWGVGNQMLTRADLLPYQEGTMRLLMQFAAYSSKAVFQPLNSKFLTVAERKRLAAIRLAYFGLDGIAFGPYVLNKIRRRYEEETAGMTPSEQEQDWVDELFVLAERGLVDPVVNGIINMFADDEFGTKTDLMVSQDMAPAGRGEIGFAPFDLVFELMETTKGLGTFDTKFPFAQATASLIKTAGKMNALLHAKPYEEMSEPELVKYLVRGAEFASGASNWERHLAMLYHRTIVDTMGNSLNLATTEAEAYAKIFGIQSYKESAYYELIGNSVKLQKEIENTAKTVVGYLDVIEDVYDPRKAIYNELSIEEKVAFQAEKEDRINYLMSIYDNAKYGDELRKAIYKEMDKQAKKGIMPAIDRMMKRDHIDSNDPIRRRMAYILKQLKNSGSKQLADQIDQIFLDSGVILKDYEEREQ